MPEYTIEYDNDVGPEDDGFWEWWEVRKDGRCVATCDTKKDAETIVAALASDARKLRHFEAIVGTMEAVADRLSINLSSMTPPNLSTTKEQVDALRAALSAYEKDGEA